MTSELVHLHEMETFAPIDANTITNKDIEKDLSSLLLMTENRYDRIKGRTCAYGRKQQLHIKIEYAAPPMV